jgi:hypothetical protein
MDLRFPSRAVIVPTFSIVSFAAITFAGCASGGMQRMPPPAPAFTSSPGTAATEGAAYTYPITATDPAGGTVTFSLAQSPAGASLSGSTLTWTPTPAQSRLANSFTVTATTSGGASAAQSWMVTPSGTVHLSWIDTYWDASGSLAVPTDWTQNSAFANGVAALVPQPDNSLLVLTGTGNADGTFTIPNVPGGHYWLRIAPVANYWTSSSTFDFGQDILGRPPKVTSSTQTTIDFSATGLDPLQTQDWFAFLTDINLLNLAFRRDLPAGSTSFVGSAQMTANFDFSQANAGFLVQYEPVALGPMNGFALGPELTLASLSIANGATNTIAGNLNPSPWSSLSIDVAGSAWATLMNHLGPGSPTILGSALTLSAQPFATNRVAVGLDSMLGSNLPLFSPGPAFTSFTVNDGTANCADSSGRLFSLPVTLEPAISADQNLGTLQYGDPFPAAWPRVFSFCEKATLQIPIPNSTTTSPFLIIDGESTALPTAPIAPLVSAVQNPTINGADFFTASMLNTTALTVSWSAPSGTLPNAYTVQLFPLATPPNGTPAYLPSLKFTTANTSATLPVKLNAGQTFVVVISARVDAGTNVETSPRRSALPTAYANIVSAPITVSPTAAAQVIQAASDAVSHMLAVEPVTTPEQAVQLRTRRIR